MRNDLNRRDDDPERSRRSAEPNAPLADREVPLGGNPTTDLINRWLDGEAPEPATLRGDAARQMELWRRIGDETARRRQVTTPPHLAANIMRAIQTDAAAVPQLDTTPWHRRTIEMSAATLIAAGAALLAAGALVASLVR